MSTAALTPDVRPTRYRKLRIAWSVWWGVVAVLLVILWVRSYRWYDIKPGGRITSANGCLHVAREVKLSWYADSTPIEPEVITHEFGFTSIVTVGPTVGSTAVPVGGGGIGLPYWLLVMSALTLVVAPWIRGLPYRFSLRTALIATTLVAVGLGVIAWLSQD